MTTKDPALTQRLGHVLGLARLHNYNSEMPWGKTIIRRDYIAPSGRRVVEETDNFGTQRRKVFSEHETAEQLRESRLAAQERRNLGLSEDASPELTDFLGQVAADDFDPVAYSALSQPERVAARRRMTAEQWQAIRDSAESEEE